MCTMPGSERTSVATSSRSSGTTETSRSTRSRRAMRATSASAPTAGMSEATMTRKSKAFQGSRK